MAGQADLPPKVASRLAAESDAIATLKCGPEGKHCLNKQVPKASRRLRHRATPMGPPSGDPQHQTRRDVRNTLDHVVRLATANRYEALSRMTVRKLRSLRTLMPDNAPLRTTIKDVIEDKMRTPKQTTERDVTFIVSFTSKKYDKLGLVSLLRHSTEHWPLHQRQ